MKRTYFVPSLFTLLLVMLLAPSLAFAQGLDLGDVQIDIGAIFQSTGALAVFAVTLVQYIRAHVWKTLDGGVLIGFVFAVCLVLAVIGFYTGLMPSAATLYAALGFGVAAGVTAVGGVNLLQRAAAKGNPELGK